MRISFTSRTFSIQSFGRLVDWFVCLLDYTNLHNSALNLFTIYQDLITIEESFDYFSCYVNNWGPFCFSTHPLLFISIKYKPSLDWFYVPRLLSLWLIIRLILLLCATFHLHTPPVRLSLLWRIKVLLQLFITDFVFIV